MVLSIFMAGGDREPAPIMWIYYENPFYPQITQISADFFCFYRENTIVLRDARYLRGFQKIWKPRRSDED